MNMDDEVPQGRYGRRSEAPGALGPLSRVDAFRSTPEGRIRFALAEIDTNLDYIREQLRELMKERE